MNSLMNRPAFLLLSVAYAIAMSGCATQERLTHVPPYTSIVGQRYILIETCYTYYYRGSRTDVKVGTPKRSSYLPRNLETNNLPMRFGSIVLTRRVPKGSRFVVKEIVRERNIETSYYLYRSVLTFVDGQSLEVDVSPLMDLTKTPPTVIGEVAAMER